MHILTLQKYLIFEMEKMNVTCRVRTCAGYPMGFQVPRLNHSAKLTVPDSYVALRPLKAPHQAFPKVCLSPSLTYKNNKVGFLIDKSPKITITSNQTNKSNLFN